jgi:hypothetical protein
MEEHQNNMYVQDSQGDSGEGTAKVIKAGSEARAGRRVLRGGATNGGNPAQASDHAAEAARSAVRASQQAVEGTRAATYAVAEESIGGGKVLDEWPSFIERALERNTQALSDLMDCYTLSSLLQWQSNLLSATVVDWVGTNARILRLVTYKA